MKHFNRQDIEKVAEEYTKGMVLRLVSSEDYSMQSRIGLNMVVEFVDGIGQIHGIWSNGSTVAINLEADTVEKVFSASMTTENAITYTKEQIEGFSTTLTNSIVILSSTKNLENRIKLGHKMRVSSVDSNGTLNGTWLHDNVNGNLNLKVDEVLKIS